MNGRLIVALVGLALPAVLIGVTVEWFASNPLSMMTLIMVMLGGAFYLAMYDPVE